MATAVTHTVVMGAIAQAGIEIQSTHRQPPRLEARAAAVQVPIALIDSLLSELEVLNLAERACVPGLLQPSLRWLLDNSPVECPDLSVHVSPVELMEMLFELQEPLFALKGGDFRRRLQLDDERRGFGRDG
jgi:hypothetical protein